MKRFFALLFTLILLLSSCSTLDSISVKGENEKNEPCRSEWPVTYVANKSTCIYHFSSCSYILKVKEANKWKTNDVYFLEQRGYSPCKKCIPKQ